MYGNLANKLVLDAKRTQNLSDVTLYQHDLVQDIVKETLDLNKDAEYLNEQQQMLSEYEETTEEERKINQCQLFVTHLCMRRNKRCLLAYEKSRADKIDEFTWLNIDPIINEMNEHNAENIGNETATTTSYAMNSNNSPFLPSTTRLTLNNLSLAEQEYFKNYQNLVVNYKSKFLDLDLSGDLVPPTNIFIDVRVLKDGGEVQTEYGVFNLIKDSQFYVRKSDVERLIQQGYLEEI